MAYGIDEGCIGCGVCQPSCPVDAIHDGGDGYFWIDQAACTSCGACEGTCPVDAIHNDIPNFSEGGGGPTILPLASSGTLSMGGDVSQRSINLRMSRSATSPISLGESSSRTLCARASGSVSMSDFYGK